MGELSFHVFSVNQNTQFESSGLLSHLPDINEMPCGLKISVFNNILLVHFLLYLNTCQLLHIWVLAGFEKADSFQKRTVTKCTPHVH